MSQENYYVIDPDKEYFCICFCGNTFYGNKRSKACPECIEKKRQEDINNNLGLWI